MIVFDLRCGDHGHVFEAWFGSTDAYERQRAGNLIICPVCGCSDIEKAVMAPNVATKSNSKPSSTISANLSGEAGAAIADLMGRIAAIQAEALPSAEWVGSEFGKRARAMDAGHEPHGSIYDEATAGEFQSLIEEGVGVMPLLVPIVPPSKQN